MYVIKRDGRKVEYESSKIYNALKKASIDSDSKVISDVEIQVIAESVDIRCNNFGRPIEVEEIQEIVIAELIRSGNAEIALKYSDYMYKRAIERKQNTTDQQVLSMLALENSLIDEENSNKEATRVSTQRDYIAGIVSRDLSERYLIPQDLIEANNEGYIHLHDLDYFAQNCLSNCHLISLAECLDYGTVISDTKIDPPKSFLTACNLTAQLVSLVASGSYGGCTFNLYDLVKYIDVSRNKFRKLIQEELDSADIPYSADQLEIMVEKRVDEEIKNGAQALQYELITLSTTNGQAPFVSEYINLTEAKTEQEEKDYVRLVTEVFKQRIQGVKNLDGVWTTPEFPKLLLNINPDLFEPNGKYYELGLLSAKCTSLRMSPDWISEKIQKEMTGGDTFGCMGCRSFLGPDVFSEKLGNISKRYSYKPGDHIYWGRFNTGVQTASLLDVALTSIKENRDFWKVLDERLELLHRMAQLRIERLSNTKAKVNPSLWCYGVCARLDPEDTLDTLVHNGYATASIGFAGLHECVVAITGKSLSTLEGLEFGQKVLSYMNERCKEWREAENVWYSLYSTPLESTCYKFAKSAQRRFGIIPGLTDKAWLTNSFHLDVREGLEQGIDAFTKLSIEGQLSPFATGGQISFVEVPNLTSNLEVVMQLMKHIYNTNLYGEINTRSDYCYVCKQNLEIQQVRNEETGKLEWTCPHCGNKDESKMDVIRRTCGYIGSHFWNTGKDEELAQRALHL